MYIKLSLFIRDARQLRLTHGCVFTKNGKHKITYLNYYVFSSILRMQWIKRCEAGRHCELHLEEQLVSRRHVVNA